MALWICEECNYGLESKIKPSACPCCGKRGVLSRIEAEESRNTERGGGLCLR